MSIVTDVLQDALIPLATPPQAPAWNHATITHWLGVAPLVHAAVLVGIRENADANVVFTRRNDRLATHAGQVAFPGGSSDAGDADPVATALREAHEEVGLPPDATRPLGYLDCFETTSRFCVTPVVARIADDAPPWRANATEVAEVFEVPLDFFLEPANAHHYVMDRRGVRQPMVEFLFDGHRIWGATALMMTNLIKRMGRA